MTTMKSIIRSIRYVPYVYNIRAIKCNQFSSVFVQFFQYSSYLFPIPHIFLSYDIFLYNTFALRNVFRIWCNILGTWCRCNTVILAQKHPHPINCGLLLGCCGCRSRFYLTTIWVLDPNWASEGEAQNRNLGKFWTLVLIYRATKLSLTSIVYSRFIKSDAHLCIFCKILNQLQSKS